MDPIEVNTRLRKVLETSKEGVRKVEEARVLAQRKATLDLPGVISEIERLAGCGQNEIQVRFSVPQQIIGRAIQEYVGAYENAIRQAIFQTPGFSGCSGGTCCGKELQSFGIKWE